MHQTYSKRETMFEVEPDLEIQANETVNQLGSNYILEGAKRIGENYCKIWYRDINSCHIGWIQEPIRKQNEESLIMVNYVEHDILNLATWVVSNQGQNYLLEGAKKTGDGYCRIWMRNLLTDELKSISCPLDQKIDGKTEENIKKYDEISEIINKVENSTPKLIEDGPSKINSEYFIFYK